MPYSWARLRHSILFAAALFACANLAVYWSSEYFQEERKYQAIAAEVASHDGVKVLLAGDSHIAHALNEPLNSNAATPAYSLAYPGDSLRECYAKLRYALTHTKGIEAIIVSGEPHMFGKGRLQSSNRAFADRYFLLAADRSGLDRGFAPALLNQVPLMNDDYTQYLRKLVMMSFKSKKEDPLRDLAKKSSWVRLTESARAQLARKVGTSDHQEIGKHDEPFVWYRRILELAHAHHVRVIALKMPVHPLYAATSPPDRNAAIDLFLHRSGVAQIVDLRNLLSDPSDFDDPDHISPRAAERVLKELARQTGLPILAAPAPTD
jgi:hypothetical protein